MIGTNYRTGQWNGSNERRGLHMLSCHIGMTKYVYDEPYINDKTDGPTAAC